MAYFYLVASDMPAVRIFLEHKNQHKYKFEGDFTFEDFDAFVQAYNAGKLKVRMIDCDTGRWM